MKILNFKILKTLKPKGFDTQTNPDTSSNSKPLDQFIRDFQATSRSQLKLSALGLEFKLEEISCIDLRTLQINFKLSHRSYLRTKKYLDEDRKTLVQEALPKNWQLSRFDYNPAKNSLLIEIIYTLLNFTV